MTTARDAPMRIRRAGPADRAEWLRMRIALLPSEAALHESDIEAYFRGEFDPYATFVAERAGGVLAGFVEVATRPWAEGCETSPVSYIEAWYVDEDVRRRGIGRALFAAAEEWARQEGYREIASDAELANTTSCSAHVALGYEEVVRLVCFRRSLDPADGGR